MLPNSLIKYFKGLNERSNQISTLLFINTISSLGITLSFTANNIIVDSIFFTLLIVHSMCLTITYFYSKSHSAEVKKGSDIINNVMNNEVIKNAINDYDFIYNNNRATKEIGDEDNKETVTNEDNKDDDNNSKVDNEKDNDSEEVLLDNQETNKTNLTLTLGQLDTNKEVDKSEDNKMMQKEIEAIEQKEEPKRKRGRPKKFIETESLNTISLSKFKN